MGIFNFDIDEFDRAYGEYMENEEKILRERWKEIVQEYLNGYVPDERLPGDEPKRLISVKLTIGGFVIEYESEGGGHYRLTYESYGGYHEPPDEDICLEKKVGDKWVLYDDLVVGEADAE